MIYFAYSHITVITLLAFAAINEVQGESWAVGIIKERLALVKNETLGIMSHMKRAEGQVRTIKERIFIRDPASWGVIKNHSECLETAYEYKWGTKVFSHLAENLHRNSEADLSDVVNCCKEKSSAYLKKMEEFPVKKCLENLPSANSQDLDQLNSEIGSLYYHKHYYGIYIFLEKLYKTQLKVLGAY
ncbi:unnamed protein product [Trichobilharzia szidati]|nr:unnamed protein product [Trichobilharzia szidati]